MIVSKLLIISFVLWLQKSLQYTIKPKYGYYDIQFRKADRFPLFVNQKISIECLNDLRNISPNDIRSINNILENDIVDSKDVISIKGSEFFIPIISEIKDSFIKQFDLSLLYDVQTQLMLFEKPNSFTLLNSNGETTIVLILRGETILDDINVITSGDYAVLSIHKESKLRSLVDESVALVITGNKISGSQLFEDYKTEVFNSIKFQESNNIFGDNQLSNDLQVKHNLNSSGFLPQFIRSNLNDVFKSNYLELLSDSIFFDNWIGAYLTKSSLFDTQIVNLHPRLTETVHKFSVRSRGKFENTRDVVWKFVNREINLRRAENTKILFIGKDDGRGMHTLFINGNMYFLPPPLNKFVGRLLCDHRVYSYELFKEHLFIDLENNTENINLDRLKLESIPFYRLLFAFIEKDYFYAVDRS